MKFIDCSSEDYSDIIDLPHLEPTRKPRMPMRKRAAQFRAFIPFSGFLEEIKKMDEEYRAEGESYYVKDDDCYVEDETSYENENENENYFNENENENENFNNQ